MGFVSGLVIGISLGIAFVYGWSRMMALRSRKRVAKVKWLNKQLSKLWPFVAEAATMVIRESVEPLLDNYKPPGIASLKFSKLSLGQVSPKIEGIRIQKQKEGQVTMDLDFRWGGDPSIILGVDARVASLPIQLKDLQVFTVVRVIFQLCEEMPCISAVVVALLADPKPRIDYTLKAVGGSLTAVPGLSDMIDDTVNSIISDMLLWPHRIVVPLGGVNVDIRHLKPEGKLMVTVVRAKALKNKEVIGKSDPYVIVYIRPILKVKTRVIDDNLNPEWNETFNLLAEDRETQSLYLEVYDEDKLKQDKKLGVVALPLKSFQPEALTEFNLNLLSSLDTLKVKDKKDRGTLTIKALYHTFTKQEQIAALEQEKREIELRQKLKDSGAVGSTMDAIGGAASLVGSGIGSGLGAVGSSISRAGKFMGRTVTNQFSSSRRHS
ncbi:synaptotagmin-4-like isoform X1 [Carex littledalei]|uniref:Synaptotagmin-4-like isoform X1 n=1 Tax=Carex littledalei TaxID=544730 RepID=A0A833QQM4_9POAL|nr:synaptotagmin-4-like isoform X1 [Carex littledalei]